MTFERKMMSSKLWGEEAKTAEMLVDLVRSDVWKQTCESSGIELLCIMRGAKGSYSTKYLLFYICKVL